MTEPPTGYEAEGGGASTPTLGPQTDSMSNLSARGLLQSYAQILTELTSRGITRTRNAPVADVAEYLVMIAYEGHLAPNSQKSWDVLAADQRRIQVKSRLVGEKLKGTQQYSPFRSWDFDACVFVTFDFETYEVIRALEVPPEGIKTLASAVPHVGATAYRVNTRTPLATLPGAMDVSEKLRAAASELDRRPSA